MASDQPEEPWIYVTGKRHRHSGTKSAVIKHVSRDSRTSAHLSAAEIKSDHQRIKQQWTESSCCENLKQLMLSKSSGTDPSNAICLGLGSFDPPDGSWQVKRRTHVQLAAFTTIVECLKKRSNQDIRCVFQEPCFTPHDKEFLASLGYEVVDSPAGFEMVADDSLVYGIHLYRAVYSMAIENHIPAIFIGTGYDAWESCADINATKWVRMKEMDQISEKATFKDDDDFYPAFTSTTIHWRRPEEKEQS